MRILFLCLALIFLILAAWLQLGALKFNGVPEEDTVSGVEESSVSLINDSIATNSIATNNVSEVRYQDKQEKSVQNSVGENLILPLNEDVPESMDLKGQNEFQLDAGNAGDATNDEDTIEEKKTNPVEAAKLLPAVNDESGDSNQSAVEVNSLDVGSLQKNDIDSLSDNARLAHSEGDTKPQLQLVATASESRTIKVQDSEPLDETEKGVTIIETSGVEKTGDQIFTLGVFSSNEYRLPLVNADEELKIAVTRLVSEIPLANRGNLIVQGHTDNTPVSVAPGKPYSNNTELSLLRAQLVADLLIDNGIQANSIMVVGIGEKSPIASNETEEGRRKNRRVEVLMLAGNAKARN